nr:S41 family peptidase [Candidatus Krumholzibacteria bacterium]
MKPRMSLSSFALVLGLVLVTQSALATEVFMPRRPAVSPDGQTVVFGFQGDLWSVSSKGGQALRLTAHEAYDTHPVFSPDGKHLAFASNRYGDHDIYLMPVIGGAPTRLTFSSINEAPDAFSPDGEMVYFASGRLFEYPMGRQIHAVPTKGGTPMRLVDIFGDEVATADGKTFIIAEGRVKEARLRYRGTYQRELYSWTKGSDPVQLTDNRGYDMNPMVAPDGRIYWIGDQNDAKTFNIFTMAADGSGKTQLTNYKDDGIRAASLSADGRTLVFERATSLYLLPLDGTGKAGKAQEMKIQVAADVIENPVVIENKTADASEMAVSSDGEEFALVIDGEIVLVNKDLGGRATVPMTGPYRERQISFKPGTSDTLMFVTDSSGEDQICLLVADNEDDPTLRTARKFKVIELTDHKRPATEPLWSPEGDRILFTRGNADLWVMDADGDNEKELFKGWSLSSYSWAPDGRWIAYSRNDANFNSDVFIMPSEGGEAVNITRHPDADDNPVWSADGSMLAWTTSRHNPNPNSRNNDVYFVYLQRELDERTDEEWKIWEKTRDKDDKKSKGKNGKDGKKDAESDEDSDDDNGDDKDKEEAEEEKFEIAIDFEDIYLRARRLTSKPGAEYAVAIDPKGDRIYFVAMEGRESDPYSLDRFGKEEEQVTKGNTRPMDIELDAKGKTFTFLKSGKPSWTKSDGGKIESTDFNARLTIDRPAARLQALDEGWRMLRDNFYDADMHGVDWPKLRKKYGAWAQQVGHDVDFGDVVNFMLGELNASHMGYYPRWETFGNYGTDGFLGLEFTSKSGKDGLVVDYVLPYGPCDKVKSRLEPGDVLKTVEGQDVSTRANLYAALETRADLPTWITIERDGQEMEFSVVPTTWGAIRNLAYRKMENDKRAATESATDGRVGYVHIQGMGWGEVERFEQNLFAAADGKEALIIDVRNNGGGWTTDLLLTILTQPVHAYTIPRDGDIGYPQTERQPFYRWSKPIAVICNEGSYSNAEIFSHAIKTIGRGPVVGWETGGNVISTSGFGNRYEGYIRLPFRGWYVWGDKKDPKRNHKNQEGVHELTGFIPDYPVKLTPSDRLHGRDPQLQKAIDLMVKAADAEKAKPQREDRP